MSLSVRAGKIYEHLLDAVREAFGRTDISTAETREIMEDIQAEIQDNLDALKANGAT